MRSQNTCAFYFISGTQDYSNLGIRDESEGEIAKFSASQLDLMGLTVIEANGRFLCGVCKRDYTNKGACVSHMQTHAGQTTCNICGKTYNSMGDLKKHLKVHQGKTVCPICNKICSRISNLNAHLRNVHKVPAPKTWARAHKCHQLFLIMFFNRSIYYLFLRNWIIERQLLNICSKILLLQKRIGL